MTEGDSSAKTPAPSRTYLGLAATEWTAGAVALSLDLAVNVLLPDRFHVPASIAAAAVVSRLAMRTGASPEKQGLRLRDAPRGMLYGLAAALPIAATLGAGVRLKRLHHYYRAGQVAQMSPERAVYEVLVRVPLGTALPEEIIFRGALLGLLSLHHRRFMSVILSSLLFGLWHVVPALQRVRAEPGAWGQPPVHKLVWLAGSIGTTSVAGVLLAWLRNRSGSIVAPWLAHAAANAAGLAGGRAIAGCETTRA